MKHVVFLFLFVQDSIVNVLASNKKAHRMLFIKHIEPYRWAMGRWRAWRTYYRALRKVPAYRPFLLERSDRLPKWRVPRTSLRPIPEMDKDNYIKRYSIEDRSYGGALPTQGVVVDESSGSSGQPTSWVRGAYERLLVSKILQVMFEESVDNRPEFVINAFALGAWATGMNVSASLTDVSILKSTGPDIDKIIATLKEFGPDYSYVVMGYPPFLKNLVDDERINLAEYDIIAGYGGEGLSESMRRYLLQSFKKVTGSYGASDLEINIAIETDMTIHLRKALEQNSDLREELIRSDDGTLPMVFQYNPYDYVIESNQEGELLVTIARKENISPRIRYNIHDKGHVLRLRDVRKVLKRYGMSDILADAKLDLPILFHYGRSDMSIDFYGANVTPDSVRQILFDIDTIATNMNTFNLVSVEDESHNTSMAINVELIQGVRPSSIEEAKVGDKVFKQLADINRDFYNAYYNTAPKNSRPTLNFYEYQTGPFEGSGKKLKHEYVKTDVEYDTL